MLSQRIVAQEATSCQQVEFQQTHQVRLGGPGCGGEASEILFRASDAVPERGRKDGCLITAALI